MNETSSQSIQNAIAACNNSHTLVHRAIGNLKRGSKTEAKQQISQSIEALANALMVL